MTSIVILTKKVGKQKISFVHVKSLIQEQALYFIGVRDSSPTNKVWELAKFEQ